MQHAIIISLLFIPSVDNFFLLFPQFDAVIYQRFLRRPHELKEQRIYRSVIDVSFIYLITVVKIYNFIYLQLQLACDEWRRSMIGTVQTIGGLLSLPITGFISDHWGRRFALSFNALNITWLGLVRYWVNNYNAFLAVEILKSTSGGGGFSCAYILGTSSFIYFFWFL